MVEGIPTVMGDSGGKSGYFIDYYNGKRGEGKADILENSNLRTVDFFLSVSVSDRFHSKRVWAES